MNDAVRYDLSKFPTDGQIIYVINDLSFRFYYNSNPNQLEVSWNIFSIAEIEIDLLDGQWRGVSGYSPFFSWSQSQLHPPTNLVRCRIYSTNYQDYLKGAGQGLVMDRPEPCYYDASTGWFCTGNPQTPSDVAIEFAKNCIASLRGDCVVSVWLHAENWKEVSDAIAAHNLKKTKKGWWQWK
ncbi:hypothetical protein [Planctomicrobium sp. SH664]|uniref:hypothetical protein n=1 Tax=Planctomicrobium sp. SH664 TaxID=3448125 RepID=UPI003F5BBE2B